MAENMNSADVGTTRQRLGNLVNTIAARFENNDLSVATNRNRLALLHDRIDENDFHAGRHRDRVFTLRRSLFHPFQSRFLDRCHCRLTRQLAHRWRHIRRHVTVVVRQLRTRRCNSSIKHDTRLKRQTRV